VLRSARLRLMAALVAVSPCACADVAAQSAPAVASKPPPCAPAEHRQFDFWLGDWEVKDPAGKVVGHNRIEAAHGGCALIEHWTSVTGVSGTSLNIYDRDRGKWHQTWVDSGGGLLQLDGGFTGGAMVLAGDAFDADAPSRSARQRVTWTPLADGRVRQLWESSTDGGKTWTVVFDGLYARKA
jgi:hypothetical protein